METAPTLPITNDSKEEPIDHDFKKRILNAQQALRRHGFCESISMEEYFACIGGFQLRVTVVHYEKTF